MKTLKKVLTIISCLCFSLAISLNVFGASASTIGGVTVKSFTMENGAWIRVDEESGNGIKFNAFLDTETYDTLEGLENATVNYGMVIVPNDMLPAGGMTVDMLKDTVNNHFTNEENCACGKTHYAIVEYETLPNNPDAENKILRGSIVDIKTGNVIRPYTAVAYIEYVGDTTEYYLASYANGDIANSTRSMAYVAQMAIKDGKDTDGSIEATYVTPYTTGDYANKFPYTVNHYINGAEQAPVTEKLYGTLGETVTAKHILNSTVENAKELYKAYGLYGFTNDTISSSVLYADGKTVINVYYEELDTSFHNVVNNADYYLMGANKNLTGATTTWHDSITLNNETKDGVVQIDTTAADQWTAGQFRMAFNKTYYEMAVANNYAYIKLHMYIAPADASVEKINFLSKNQTVVSNVKTGEWVDIIVPLAVLNQYDTYIGYKGTKEAFEKAMLSSHGWDSSSGGFLTTNSIKTGIGLTSTDVTYYIDEVSWGIDTQAPEITISGLAEEVFEGVWNEPTVSVVDDLTPDRIRVAKSEYVNIPVATKLYKIVNGVREEVILTDGSAELTKGEYVYVVEANDFIYSDVVGNVATKEVEFKVVELHDYVITFNSENAAGYAHKTAHNYSLDASYVNEETLASEIAEIEASDIVNKPFDDGNGKNQTNNNPEETIFPEGGALKVVAGQESGQQYGCYLGFKLSTAELALVANATSVTFRLYVAPGDIPYWTGTGEVDLRADGKGVIASFDRYTWVDITISMDKLGSDWVKYFNGTTYIFHTNYQVMNDTNATLIYYINSITFDVTP